MAQVAPSPPNLMATAQMAPPNVAAAVPAIPARAIVYMEEFENGLLALRPRFVDYRTKLQRFIKVASQMRSLTGALRGVAKAGLKDLETTTRALAAKCVLDCVVCCGWCHSWVGSEYSHRALPWL